MFDIYCYDKIYLYKFFNILIILSKMNNGLVSFTLFVHVSKQLHPSRGRNFVNIAISDSRFWFQKNVIGMYGLRKFNIFGVVIWVTKVIPPGCSEKE